MSALPAVGRRVLGGGAGVLLIVLLPLWGEMREPGNTVWNISLAAFLIVVAVAAFLLQRYLVHHIDEVGEARFDTQNKSNHG